MNEILMGILLPLLLGGTGLFLLFYLKGYPFRRPRVLLRSLFQKNEDGCVSPQNALLTALAGTLGVGNITGVAAAIILGGAGALFWMWVCALFSMVIKYAEIVLAMKTKKNGHGGPMYYLKNKPLSVLFALICLACGFAMGNMVQVCAACDAVQTVIPDSKWIVAFLFLVILMSVLRKGSKGVFAFSSKVVPIMTLFYCLLCGAYLFVWRAHIPEALYSVWKSAWNTKAVGGGIFGSSLISGLRYGAARGMISNEAGCGTAPIAHSASSQTPAAQGCLGIAEVFIDTILLCTLTGLCVLVAPRIDTAGGTELMISIFARQFGTIAGYLLVLCMILFSFATVVCWFYYCLECIRYLTGSERLEKPFILLFSLLCPLAPIVGEGGLFAATDLLVCLMAFLNLPAIFRMRRIIGKETLEYFQ